MIDVCSDNDMIIFELLFRGFVNFYLDVQKVPFAVIEQNKIKNLRWGGALLSVFKFILLISNRFSTK